MSAGKPFQMSVAVASQLCLNLSSVLKLQRLTSTDVQLGHMNKADETCKELEFHITVGTARP